jgi:hypothetical protein
VTPSPSPPTWATARRFDRAIADLAETYADQNEHDHAALRSAIAEGRLEATPGV